MNFTNIFPEDFKEQSEKFGLKKVENEEQIQKDLEKKMEIDSLKDQIDKLRDEYETKRKQELYQRVQKYDTEKTKLSNRLYELMQEKKQDDYDKQLNIIKLKQKLKAQQQDEMEKQMQLFELRKKHDLERIVKKKLELERIAKERKKKEKYFNKLDLQLKVIQDEQDQRNINSHKMLEKALGRENISYSKALIQNGALALQDQALLMDILSRDKLEKQDIQTKELLLNQMQAKAKQYDLQKAQEGEEFRRKLNEQRLQMMEQEEALVKKKAIHEALKAKGLNYITEVEYGATPPIQYLSKNWKIDYDKYKKEQPELQSVVQKSQQYIQQSQKRIALLQQDLIHEDLDDDLEYYKYLLQEDLKKCNLESVTIARAIVYEIINQAKGSVKAFEKRIQNIKQQQSFLEQKNEKFSEQYSQMEKTVDCRRKMNQMVDSVTKKYFIEIMAETTHLNMLAKKHALEILVKAMSLKKINPEQKFPFFFDHIKYSSWKNKYRNIITPASYQSATGLRGKARMQRHDQAQYQDPIDQVQNLPVESCVEIQGTSTLQKAESQFWEYVQLQKNENEKYECIDPDKENFFITSIALSKQGKQLLAGTSQGRIFLFYVDNPTELRACTLAVPNKSRVTNVVWSLDQTSQFISLLATGDNQISQLFHNKQIQPRNTVVTKKKDIPYTAQSQKTIEQKHQSIYELAPIEEINYQFFEHNMQQNKLRVKDAYQITYATFFPSFCFTGLQTSILLGTKSGLIMKFNSNKNIENKQNQFYQLQTECYNKQINTEDPKFPQKGMNFDILKDQLGQDRNIFRQLFRGHTFAINFITYNMETNNIISVDNSGQICKWEYSQRAEKHNSEFNPKETYLLNLESILYMSNAKDKEKILDLRKTPEYTNQKLLEYKKAKHS